MSDREFIITSKQYGDTKGNYRLFSDLTCSKCGATESINITAGRNPMPDQAIRKKWLEHGWRVSKRFGDDVCPNCIRLERAPITPYLKLPAKKEPDKTGVVELSASVIPPKNFPNLTRVEPTRAEKRTINDLLAGVYEPDKGYLPGWSDQKVATDLGVPRKWVEDIRKEYHGDNAANDDVVGFLKDFDQLSNDVKGALADCKKLTENYSSLSKAMAAIQSSLGSINDRVNRLERTANDLRKLLP